MAISEFHASTVIRVRVCFGFSEIACDPEELTNALQVQPDEVALKGEVRSLGGGREIRELFNSWTVESHVDSKDVNDHVRELLERVRFAKDRFRPEFGRPSFDVLWEGNYLYAGSGPFYEADVIARIASLGADLWQDIYQIDEDDAPPGNPDE
jgi:hypothetical protein